MQRKSQNSLSNRSRQMMLMLIIIVGMLLGNVLTTAAAPAARAVNEKVNAIQAATLPATTCAETATNERECNLWATTGTLSLPDGSSVPIWGYADSDTGTAQLPGPLLIVNEGDLVTVNLTNNLTSDTSLYFPGQNIAPDFVGAPASGGTASYTFIAKAGTYRYEAGFLPNAQHQVAMGMYGALIVRPSTPNQAYDSAVSAYDDEAVAVLSEIDPALNNSTDPSTFDMRNFKPAYWLINGMAYPDTAPIETVAGNDLLIRYVNAGLEHHAMTVLGLDQILLAEDGFPYAYNRKVVGKTVAAGQTMDVLVNIPATVPDSARLALYDGDLLLHNNNDDGFGGMMTFITTPGDPTIDDIEGPATTAVSVSPSPTAGTVNVTLSATVSDVATGNANIATAEYYIDNTTGTPIPMDAVDTAYDSPTEAIQATLSPATVIGLGAGDHTLYVRGQDVNGNWGPFNLATLRVELSGAGPTTKGLSLTHNPSSGGVNVKLSGTADDSATGNNSIIKGEYFIDAPGTDNTGTPMDINLPNASIVSLDAHLTPAILGGLSEGIHPVYVHGQDFLGLWGFMETIDLHVDHTGPNTTAVTVLPDPNNGNLPINQSLSAVRVDATIKDPLSAGVRSNIYMAEFFIDSMGAAGTGIPMYARDGLFDTHNEEAYAFISLVNVASLAPGTHTIYVCGRDASGNWESSCGTGTLEIDAGAPTVTGTAVTPNPTNGATMVTLTALASDAGSAVSNAEWFVGADPGQGNGTPMTLTPNGGDWDLEATIDIDGWTTGNHVLYVRARDIAGTWSAVGNVVLNNNNIANTYGVTLSPATDTLLGIPTSTVSYQLTVGNTGNVPDTVDVSIAGNGWTTVVPATVGPIPAGGSAQLVVDVTIPGTAVAGDIDTVDVTVTSQGDVGQSATSSLTTAVTEDQLYFSTAGNVTVVTGLSGDDADIYSWDGAGFARIFDASAAGLPGNADVDGLQVVDNDTFYLSFNRDVGTNVPTVGVVQDEDIVLYDAGVWTLYLDGDEVGLGNGGAEDIDAFAVLPNGHILISGAGPFNPDPEFTQNRQDEDIIECTPVGPAPITQCTWSVYLDGSDLGLGSSWTEDVNGLSVKNGDLYLSTVGAFSASGLSGNGSDVMNCSAPTLGLASACTAFTMYFDGSAEGVTNQIDAIDIPNLNSTPPAPVYNVGLSPTTATMNGAPAATVSYQLTVENTGNTEDTVDVSIAGNGWSTTVPATVGPIPAGGSAQLVVDVTISGTAVAGDSDAVTVTVTSQGEPAQSAASTLTTSVTGDQLYFSTNDNFVVPGVSGAADDADIYSWDGVGFARIFDASGAGLPGYADVDGLHVVDSDTIYLSFKANGGTSVPGLGSVQDEDIVLYDAGVWTLYFDGSVFGLANSNGEDIDAFTILSNGNILISGTGTFNPAGFGQNRQDEDILECSATVVGSAVTQCAWSDYIDGSDIGLSNSSNEDVNGLSIKNGDLYLSTNGAFSVSGLSGTGYDVMTCTSPITGATSSCSGFTLYFEGAAFSLLNQVDAISLP